MTSRFTRFRDRLAESGYAVLDGHQANTATLPNDYYVLSVTERALTTRLAMVSGDLEVAATTICASRDRDGVRRLIGTCRDLFTDWSEVPGRADPLHEEESGPILRDIEGRDVRYSATIVHRCITYRQEPHV